MAHSDVFTDRRGPTVLSEHGDGSDELHARRVHRDEDHAVQVVPERRAHHEHAKEHVLVLFCFFF